MSVHINRTRLLVTVTGWVTAIAIAAVLDRTVAHWTRQSGVDLWLQSHDRFRETLKTPGSFLFTVVAAVLLAIFHRHSLWASAFLLVGTVPAALNQISKWVLGRTRPFTDIYGKIDDLTPFTFNPLPGWAARNLSFPSGHAALAFATAAALSILLPRWRWAFYAVATCVAAERVLENAHWLSDVAAAAALGIGGVWVVRVLWWDKHKGNEQHGFPVLVAGDPGV